MLRRYTGMGCDSNASTQHHHGIVSPTYDLGQTGAYAEEDVLRAAVNGELDRRWEQSTGGQLAALGSSKLQVKTKSHEKCVGNFAIRYSAP